MDTYDIKGLPTLMILNRNSLLTWKGRYCCYEYTMFENFLNHTISEIIELKCPITNCEICFNDTSIDQELHGSS